MAESEHSASAKTLAVPPSWIASTSARKQFFDGLRRTTLQRGSPLTSRPTLICDYDGTLAPFHQDKMQAYPYPGIEERLATIAKGPTKLAFVSGRPVKELIALLPLAAKAEIWGMHGREHRTAEGSYTLLEPTDRQRASLDVAQEMLQSQGLSALLERKTASVAVHWRALESQHAPQLKEVQRVALETFASHAGKSALALLPFDGGLELRAADYTKRHATKALLDGADAQVAAFLGDDMTDEDAFQAMRAHGGLALLVREPPRASHALFSLKPPGELLTFLDDWLSALA